MIEPYDDNPYSGDLVYFLGQAYKGYAEREDARNKVEAAIAALKKIGSVALRTRVMRLEEQLLSQIKREKDVHVILQKRSEVKKHFEESVDRIDKEIDRYVQSRLKHKRMRDVEQKVIAVQELRKRLEHAEQLVAQMKVKGNGSAIAALEERINALKKEIHEA
ncbi:hypothetical protein HY486_04210 [Candidatus Woesearchaeota archaeon]|nr:hypothetical protein [Candidatus Woesearchaeota archaeon]